MRMRQRWWEIRRKFRLRSHFLFYLASFYFRQCSLVIVWRNTPVTWTVSFVWLRASRSITRPNSTSSAVVRTDESFGGMSRRKRSSPRPNKRNTRNRSWRLPSIRFYPYSYRQVWRSHINSSSGNINRRQQTQPIRRQQTARTDDTVSSVQSIRVDSKREQELSPLVHHHTHLQICGVEFTFLLAWIRSQMQNRNDVKMWLNCVCKRWTKL